MGESLTSIFNREPIAASGFPCSHSVRRSRHPRFCCVLPREEEEGGEEEQERGTRAQRRGAAPRKKPLSERIKEPLERLEEKVEEAVKAPKKRQTRRKVRNAKLGIS